MRSGHIYVISNASMGIFPLNSRAKFSNELPKAIKPKDAESNSLFISLESLVMENSFIENTAPNAIQIVCRNICPNLTGEGHDFVIETVPWDFKKKILEYRPRLKKVYKINTHEIKSVELELTDENNNLIKFSTGIPTIVKLQISEMPNRNNNFYVRVSCNDSKDIFSKNTCASFAVKLPKKFQLDSNWKVSLTSIYLPKNIHNIYHSMNKIMIEEYSKSGIQKNSNTIDFELEQTYSCSIQSGYYDSPRSLAQSINSALAGTPIRVNFHEENYRFFFSGNNKDTNRKHLFKITLSKKLLGALGFEPRLLLEKEGDSITLNFQYFKAFENLDVLTYDTFSYQSSDTIIEGSYSSFLFPEIPKMNFSISPWVFVYCNIIEPCITGDSTVPLLKVIPLNFYDFKRGHAIEFENFEFSALSLYNFQSIQFEIRNHNGSLLSTDEENLMVTLLFQKFS